MNRSDTARLVHRVREADERRAAQDLGRGLEAERLAREQLETLRGWRHQYANEQQLRMIGGAVSAADLQRQRQFLAEIDAAIGMQRTVLTEQAGSVARLRARWQDQRIDRGAAEQLLDRAVDAERRDRARREQAESDDWVNQRRPASIC